MMRWAVGEGHISVNPARDARLNTSVRHKAPDLKTADFDSVEVDAITIPTPEAAAAILAAADAHDQTGRAGAQFRLLFNGGLRPPEMLGFAANTLRFGPDGRAELKIVQRAEHRRGTIGPLKNAASRRRVVLGRDASEALRKYFLAVGQPSHGLLFPTRSGRSELYSNFVDDVWAPVLGAAGCAREIEVERTFCGPRQPDGGRPNVRRKVKVSKAFYTPHQGRHFAASALIAAGAAAKKVQHYLGHSRIEITMNVYGHLFPDQRAEHDLADAIDRQLKSAG
jgi:integrase